MDVTQDQILLFLILVIVFGLLVHGRWRYDIVAFAALIVCAVLGIVTPEDAFSGFGHPAVIIVALVLLISHGLSSSGVVELVASHMTRTGRGIAIHTGIMASLAAMLSAMMNNVAALALLMPVDIRAANREQRSPALTLMPLSFACILGGMVTLIGTPSNIVIATFREKALGEPYAMFDFVPVGLTVAIIGVLYIAILGHRMLPKSCTRRNTSKELSEATGFIAEAIVGEKSSIIGKKVGELYTLASQHNVNIIGLVQKGRYMTYVRDVVIKPDDRLVMEATMESIEGFVGAASLEFIKQEQKTSLGQRLIMVEVVVPEDSVIAGRSATDLRLMKRYNIVLLGISRQGQRFRKEIALLKIVPGDMLLLLGQKEHFSDVINWLGCLPIAEREHPVLQRKKAGMSISIFAASILIASLGILSLPIALSACIVGYVVLGILTPSKVYASIEWPAIVLLASLIPIGAAFESSGNAALVSNIITTATAEIPVAATLAILMVLTMFLSDLLNNVATALIVAPIGINIAEKLHAHPDPFLMAVAVASSCAFLTPIGHKNNILILGPGGYRFGDFWRMGLPLEVLVIVVSLPMILLVWPLYP